MADDPQNRRRVRIDGLPVDVATSEQHRFPGEVTKFPVEVGADTSDHIRDLPPEITLECIVSDIPPADLANDPTRQAADPSGAPIPPSELALTTLRELKARRRPVTTETSLGKFESTALVELEVTKDKDRNNALFFTARLETVKQVTNLRTKVRVKTAMAGAGGKAKPKATAAVPVAIDKNIIWRHGVPPGSPFKPGNAIEHIEARYHQVPGKTREQILILGRTGPGFEFIEYVDAEGETLTGSRRAALAQDLVRDMDEARRQPFGPQLSPELQLRRDQNLPPGLNLSRWQLPVQPTFPTDDNALDLAAFSTPRAPTFPGGG